MERRGQGDQICKEAPGSEQISLRNNMNTLAERKNDVRKVKHKLVETKAACGGDINHPDVLRLAAKVQEAVFNHDNIRDIVLRQQTIPGLFSPATPGYKRTEAQVVELTA